MASLNNIFWVTKAGSICSRRLLNLNTDLKIDRYKNKSGAGGNRTRVQTYSSKAFYMLILFYYVGKQLETNNRLLP